MVSYLTPARMYHHRQYQGPTVTPAPSSNAANPPNWYMGHHHHHHQNYPQQYSSCMQVELPDHQQVHPHQWHHHHHSMMFQDFPAGLSGEFLLPHQPTSERDPQMSSPPSEMSSPGGGIGGSVSPPNHSLVRPTPVRSPYDWMNKPSYHQTPNPGRTRTKDKYRVVYTDHQRLELEKEFHYSRYITIRRKAELSATLGLTERQIKIWFQNRRAKERKQVKKREESIQKDESQRVSHSGNGVRVRAPIAMVHHQQTPPGMMHHPQQQQPPSQQQQLPPQQQQQQQHHHHHDLGAHLMPSLKTEPSPYAAVPQVTMPIL